MKSLILMWSIVALAAVHAQGIRKVEKSRLDTDPEVIYLDHWLDRKIQLKVAKAAPVFSDRKGSRRLGQLQPGQTVQLEAITDQVYRIRSEDRHRGIAGWVAPWAFEAEEPDFKDHLKKFYERQIQVQKWIDAKQAALGMTMQEVEAALGQPDETNMRQTAEGECGTWKYVDYEEVKHYTTRVDPVSKIVYRQLSHIERVERGRTEIEFEDQLVKAIEQSENRRGKVSAKVVPPLFLAW